MTHSELFNTYGTLCVPTIPGDRKPLIAYSHWRNPDQAPDLFDYADIWDKHQNADTSVLCGTGDLYCIDVDAKNSKEIAAKFLSQVSLDGLYVERTTSGGTHVWFRYKARISGVDVCFAKTLSGYRPVVEVRGTNNLCRIAPSGGITGVSGSITGIPYISEDRYDRMLSAAESLNERPPEEKVIYQKPEKVIGLESPGDDYSCNEDIENIIDMFSVAGWTVVKRHGRRVLLRRPGARTKNHDADLLVDKRVFKCYSPSVSEFDSGKAYSFFACYTILNHNKDYTSAAKSLAAKGFGKSVTVNTGHNTWEDDDDDTEVPEVNEAEDKMWKMLQGRSIKVSQPPSGAKYTLVYNDFNSLVDRFTGDRKFGVGVNGSIGYISGGKKSRKTTIVTAIAASSISKKWTCGFKLRNDGDFVWIDTEQPTIWAYQTARRVALQANVRELPPNYHFFALRGIGGAKTMLEAIKLIVKKFPNLTTLIVDGIKDLADDYVGGHKEAGELMSYFMYVTEGRSQPCTFLTVIHTNKSDGQVRGHLGAELQNKCDFGIMIDAQDDDTSEMSFPVIRGTGQIQPVRFEALRGNIPHILNHPIPVIDYTIGDFPIEDIGEDDDPPVVEKKYEPASLRAINEDDIPF